MQQKSMNFDFSMEKNPSEITLFGSSTAATLFSIKLTPVNSTSHDSDNTEEQCNLDEEEEEIIEPIPGRIVNKIWNNFFFFFSFEAKH